ncbi:WD40 repeat domain-containing protein [Actinocorallia libanotica]|uniref:WD40 repeat domain-containing protein n=1 Tax=Actinocorallia libanotica TaxID=46162 RepID=UPI003CD0B4B2
MSRSTSARAASWRPVRCRSSGSGSSDGTILATGSWDDTVRLWDAATRRPIGKPLTGHTDAIYSVVFNRDGATLVTGSHDQTVRLWRL